MADLQKSEGTFRKLVRSLSRSSPRPREVQLPRERSLSRPRDGQRSAGPALSTSPPPDSYFPPPPTDVLSNGEANGRARHPDSFGARASEIGEPASGQSAPGVSFAPAGADRRTRPASELETWNPPPRRTQSQRSRPTGSGGLNGRGRAVTVGDSELVHNGLGDAFVEGKVMGERRGVQLEDKVLSRRTSVKRAASAVKRAVVSVGFVPVEKAAGEKRVLILVADGSEEIEVMTPFDVFVRAGLGPVLYITLSRGARILADTQFETLKQEYKDDFDAIIIPGGAKGAERLSQDPAVQALVWSFHESGKLVGMICAGSLAAKTAGIAEGMPITSHPSVRGDLEKMYEYSDERVVVSDNLITSRGPGTALEFSLKIVEILAGERKRDEVAGPMML